MEAQQLRLHAVVLSEAQSLVPELTLKNSQPFATLAPEDPKPFSGLWG